MRSPGFKDCVRMGQLVPLPLGDYGEGGELVLEAEDGKTRWGCTSLLQFTHSSNPNHPGCLPLSL
jgi:hypothetical protein